MLFFCRSNSSKKNIVLKLAYNVYKTEKNVKSTIMPPNSNKCLYLFFNFNTYLLVQTCQCTKWNEIVFVQGEFIFQIIIISDFIFIFIIYLSLRYKAVIEDIFNICLCIHTCPCRILNGYPSPYSNGKVCNNTIS